MDRRQSSESRSSSPVRLPATRTSCDVCKRLKIKCERRGESCVHCLDRGSKCTTTVTERKKRQSNRGSSLLDIESRIKRMESVITASGLAAQWDGGSESPSETSDHPSIDSRTLIDRLSTLVINDDGSSKFIGSSSGFSIFSPQGLQWIAERTGSDDLIQFITTLLMEMKNCAPQNATELWKPASPTAGPTESEPLPPKEIADKYVQTFFDTYNSMFPLYDKATFYHNYNLQYAGKPPSDVGWYASLNIVLCMGTMVSLLEGSTVHQSDGAETWKAYFRNVSNCFAELLFQEPSLLVIQAICGMAVVQQMVLQGQTVYVLTAIAARLAYGIGLHRNLNHENLTKEEIVQRQNVFWIIYSMDKSFALRLGHPSVMSDDDIGIDLPQENDIIERRPDGTNRYGIFRCQIQLAMLESRIYSELYSARAQNKSALSRLKSVGELDKALCEWKKSLPADIQPENPINCIEEQFLPILLIHFAYFNCLTTIHRVSVHHGSWTNVHLNQSDSPLHDHQLNPRVYASQSICLAAARHSIEALQSANLKTKAACNGVMWLLLHYPLSGFLTIFAHVLQNPKDPRVASDLKLMEFVTSFFTVPDFNASQFSATAPVIFRELQIVASKFVERSNSGVAKTTTKRTHDACDLEIALSQGRADGPRPTESSPLSNDHLKTPSSFISSADLSYQNQNPPSTGAFDLPQPNGQVQQNQYLSDPLNAFGSDFFAIPNQYSLPENGVQAPPALSEYFEWDMANMWNFDPLPGQ